MAIQTRGLSAPVRRRVGALASVHLVDDLYQGAVPALLPLFAAERGYTGVAAGGLMFAATFLSSLLQPAFGFLTDRIRMPWLVWAGMLLAGVGVSASGVVNNYLYAWLMIAAAGVGIAGFHPEAARATRETAGGSTQAMSWFSVGGNIGIALAPVVVTPIVARTGLSGTPLLVLPAGLFAAAFGLRAVRARRLRHDWEAVSARPSATARSDRALQQRNDWRRFSWLLLVVIMRSIAYVGVSTFLVLYLQQRFSLSATAAAPALTVFTGVGAAGTVLGGWLADRFGRTSVIRLGYTTATLGLVGLVLSPTVVLAYAAVVLAGLGLYLPFAVHTTLGQDYLPTRLAAASGMTTGFAISAGGVLAPVLGTVADSQGRHTALAVLIIAPLVALLASFKLTDIHAADASGDTTNGPTSADRAQNR